MRIYLVRHARADKRRRWDGAGGARPLSDEGRAQAQGLVDLLSSAEIEALVSGPAVRCRQTLEPLASARRLPIQVDDRLDEDGEIDAALRLIRSLGTRPTLLCTHRPILIGVLRRLLGEHLASDMEERSEKGSVWILEGSPPRATYFAPRVDTKLLGHPVMQLVPQPLRRKRAAHDTPRLAVLDLGSTSFHLLVAEPTGDGDVRRIASERAMLLMGRELARGAGISRAFVSRAVEAARDLRAVAEEWKADEIVVVGTAALRDAANGPEVTAKLESALGAPVHLLTGHEEARLIFEAIRARISLKSGATLGLDLGGGSLELAIGDADGVRYEATLPVGVARMQGELIESDPPAAGELRALRQRVREALEPHLEAVRTLAPGRCVAVGGTARALAKLVLGDDRSPRGMLLSRARLGDLARRLGAATQEERLAMPGMNPQRAHLLPIGAEIFATALSLLGMEGLTICDWGLREGVLLELGRKRAED